MKIELLQPSEMNRVRALALKTWPDAFKNILAPEQIDYMLNWMYALELLHEQASSNQLFYMLSIDGEDLGFIGIQIRFPDKKGIKIHKLYVLPGNQGKGIGKLLIDEVIKVGRCNKLIKLLLNVNRFNKAVQFYEHLGFYIVKEENIDIGNNYLMEDYVMEYTIEG
jgi:GNAT superfamily N-acetyltransferase